MLPQQLEAASCPIIKHIARDLHVVLSCDTLEAKQKGDKIEVYLKLYKYLYMVSASTSPNQTRKFGVKFCPVSSNIATSPPPFSYWGKKIKYFLNTYSPSLMSAL